MVVRTCAITPDVTHATEPMPALDQVLAAIDAANAADPGRDEATGEAAALLYGRRMSARLAIFAPGADDVLAIAVRGQHVERWLVPRHDFPMDRPGYFRWRNTLKDRHAERLAGLMQDAGYADEAIARMRSIVRKERLKLDPLGQALEDVACLVFLEFYAPAFFAKHEDAKVLDIVRKTWSKMSAAGQAAALDLPLAEDARAIVGRALSAPA